jgi:hypothetical protein
MMKTPEEIANEVVDQLSFSSNRMVNGRLIGEQYFAAQYVADAVRAERAEIQRLRDELFLIQCKQLDYASDKRRTAKTLRQCAMDTRDRIIAILHPSSTQ